MTQQFRKGVKARGLRFDLIPPDAMAELAYVFTVGAQKYADRNWELGYKWSDSVAALKRHLSLWEAGQDWDPETNSLHIAQAMWHAVVLTAFFLRNVGEDDRGKSIAAEGAIERTKQRKMPEVKKFISEPEFAAVELELSAPKLRTKDIPD